MTEIEQAQKKSMDCLNGWVDAMRPNFNAIEMQSLKQRMTAYFREYETEIAKLREQSEARHEIAKEYACQVGIDRAEIAESRAANARLRAVLEFMIEATCTLHDHPEGQKRCREALASGDGKKELEAVKNSLRHLQYLRHAWDCYREVGKEKMAITKMNAPLDLAAKELSDAFQ